MHSHSPALWLDKFCVGAGRCASMFPVELKFSFAFFFISIRDLDARWGLLAASIICARAKWGMRIPNCFRLGWEWFCRRQTRVAQRGEVCAVWSGSVGRRIKLHLTKNCSNGFTLRNASLWHHRFSFRPNIPMSELLLISLQHSQYIMHHIDVQPLWATKTFKIPITCGGFRFAPARAKYIWRRSVSHLQFAVDGVISTWRPRRWTHWNGRGQQCAH